MEIKEFQSFQFILNCNKKYIFNQIDNSFLRKELLHEV
jgi:hypothetical protein